MRSPGPASFQHLKSIMIVLGIGLGWFFVPRNASLRRFEPAAMGQLEADMWRCYYDKRYAALGWNLWLTARGQYGFSPWDSTRLAWHAAQAAHAAQPVQSREEAYAHALPDLQAYYGIIGHATHLSSPVDDLARAELNWWVLRREHVGWQAYGQAISDVTAKLYALPEPAVHASALLRAETMDYRDQRRDSQMTEDDWKHIAAGLRESYTQLRKAIGE